MTGTMLVSSSFAVFAETEIQEEQITLIQEQEQEGVAAADGQLAVLPNDYQIADFIQNDEHWTYDEGTVAFEKGSMTYTPAAKKKSFFTYTGQKFGDGAVQLKATFDFNDGSSWGGFALRCTSDKTNIWDSNSAYLTVIKKHQIELQRYNTAGNKFLAIVDNDGFVEEGKPCNLTFGSFEVPGGVQIFLYADGKLVFNCFDGDERANVNEGYFMVYGANGATLTASDSQELENLPAGVAIHKDGDMLSTTVPAVIAFRNETENYTVSWGKNDVYQGTLTELQQAGEAEFANYNPTGVYPSVKENSETYQLTEEDTDRYFVVTVADESGKILCSTDAFFYDSIEIAKEQMIILLTECEYSYVFGEKKMIDPDDAWVVPTIENDRTLVPVRFVAESLGADVGWDAETGTVSMECNGVSIQMKIGEKTYTVDGETKEMDTEATILRSRTMVPLRVVSEAFGKKVFWEAKGLIIISDGDPVWDSVEDAEIIDGIIEAIKEYL